jgi:hypothetical protein
MAGYPLSHSRAQRRRPPQPPEYPQPGDRICFTLMELQFVLGILEILVFSCLLR